MQVNHYSIAWTVLIYQVHNYLYHRVHVSNRVIYYYYKLFNINIKYYTTHYTHNNIKHAYIYIKYKCIYTHIVLCIYTYYIYCRHAHTLYYSIQLLLFSLTSSTLFMSICCRLSVFPFHTLFHSVKNSSVIFYPHIPQFSILNLYSNMQSHRIFFRCHVRSFRCQPAVELTFEKGQGAMYDRTLTQYFPTKQNIIIFMSTKYFSCFVFKKIHGIRTFCWDKKIIIFYNVPGRKLRTNSLCFVYNTRNS